MLFSKFVLKYKKLKPTVLQGNQTSLEIFSIDTDGGGKVLRRYRYHFNLLILESSRSCKLINIKWLMKYIIFELFKTYLF